MMTLPHPSPAARSALLVVLLSGSVGGCYRYSVMPPDAPPPEPGREVRLHFGSLHSLNMGTVTVHDISTIEGEVYETPSDTVAVFTRWLHTAYAGKHAGNGAVFYVPRSDIRQIEERHILPLQTGLVAAAAVGGTLGLFQVLLTLGGGETPPEDGGEVVQIVRPLSARARIGGR
ncbi:MAG: hypothetical protein ACE5PT_02640 [Gemmatimonadales bacterium]